MRDEARLRIADILSAPAGHGAASGAADSACGAADSACGVADAGCAGRSDFDALLADAVAQELVVVSRAA